MAPSSSVASFSSAVLWIWRLAVAFWCVSSFTIEERRVNAALLTPPASELRTQPVRTVDSSRRTFFNVAAATAGWNILVPQPALASPATPPLTGAKAPFFELPNSRGEGETSLDELVQSKKWYVRACLSLSLYIYIYLVDFHSQLFNYFFVWMTHTHSHHPIGPFSTFIPAPFRKAVHWRRVIFNATWINTVR